MQDLHLIIISANPLVTDDLQEKIETMRGISAAAVFNQREPIATLMKAKKPGLVLIDLPNFHDWEYQLLQRIRRHNPNIRVVALMYRYGDLSILNYIQHGVHAFLQKGSSESFTQRVIRETLLQGFHASPEFAAELMRQMMIQAKNLDTSESLLSAEQIQIMELSASGLSNQQIAQFLSLSPRTVEGKKSATNKALQCSNQSQALRKAIRLGLISA